MTDRNLGAALAKWEEKHIKSQIASEVLCFFGMTLVVMMGLSMVGQAGNALTGYGSPALDVLATVFYFTFVTFDMQLILAIVLESKPAPSLIPSPLNEWMVGISAWLFLVLYFLIYASASLHAPEPSYRDLIVAGIANAVNLAITVYIMLRRHVGGRWSIVES